MTSYLLDSDSFIFLLKQNPGVRLKVQQVGIGSIFLSVITLAEVLHGAYYSANPTISLQTTRTLIRHFNVVDLNEDMADKYAEIKAILKRTGQTLDNLDLMIGVTALVEQKTLVTNNLRHFSRLTSFGLIIENWKT